MTRLPRVLVTFLSMAFGAAIAAAPGSGSPCRSRSLAFDDKGAAWTHVPLSKLKRDTAYQVVQEGDRPAALRATAVRMVRSCSFGATRLPAMMPGMEPINSASSISQSTSPMNQYPTPPIKVSGTA